MNPREMPENTPEQMERAAVYERGCAAYARLRAKVTGGLVLKEGPVEVCACPFIDRFNGLMSPSWPADSVEEFWRTALRLYRTTGQEMFVHFGPSARPVTLPDRIRQDGFRRSSCVHFMHFDLAEIADHPAPSGVRIERVSDFSFFEKHEHPWLGPIGAPYRGAKLRFLRYAGEGPSPRVWQFIALDQRKLVGAATLFARQDEAVLFDVFVERSHRRRGIATCLVIEACRFARNADMRAVGLGANAKSEGLYRKIGFSDAGWYSDFFLSKAGVVALDPK